MIREIIILAKSSKHGQYCIAGIDKSSGECIRPISTDNETEHSVPLKDITYTNGNIVKIFDIVKIKFLKHNPTIVQSENYTYDSSFKWICTGKSSLQEVVNFRGYDETNIIFYNDNKEIEDKDLQEYPLNKHTSLLLLNVKNPCVFVKTFYDGNKSIQLNFTYNNINYPYFKISDVAIKTEFLNKNDGTYSLKENLPVVFSLTDKYYKKNKYYKMVAQIFN